MGHLQHVVMTEQPRQGLLQPFSVNCLCNISYSPMVYSTASDSATDAGVSVLVYLRELKENYFHRGS